MIQVRKGTYGICKRKVTANLTEWRIKPSHRGILIEKGGGDFDGKSE